MHALFGYAHAQTYIGARRLSDAAQKRFRGTADERGQGTVEYVGLILLVSLLMVGMVAAMKGFNGKQGTELADIIVDKIKSAVDAISFQ
jgi:Flp pilus assembly pilin Flp